MGLTAATKLVQYYAMVGHPLTPSNMAWNMVMRNFNEQWKALEVTNIQQKWSSCQKQCTCSSERTTTTNDRAGIQKDMRLQELATEGFTPRLICSTPPLVG